MALAPRKMSDPSFPAASTLSGSEILLGVQSGANVRISTTQIANLIIENVNAAKVAAILAQEAAELAAGSVASGNGGVLVGDYPSPEAAAAAAFSIGVPLRVKAYEEATLVINPSTTSIQEAANWHQTCYVHETGTLDIVIADGGYTANTYIDVSKPGNPVRIRATALPEEIEFTSVSYALGPQLLLKDGDSENPAHLMQTYRVTMGLAADVPALYNVGDPFGVQWPVGNNDAAACAGGQIIQSISGDRRTITFDILSPKGLPVSPTELTAGVTIGVTHNRAIFPKAWLRCVAEGWGTGLAREGFANCLNGGRLQLFNLGLGFVGLSGWEGSNHDLLHATDAGSRIYLERVVCAGAGDKVLRGFQGGEFRANNCWIGGAGKADELYQGVAGGGVSFVRTTLGGARVRGVTAGSACHIQSSAALLAACSDGVTVTGAGASAAWRASQIWTCQNGVRQTNGVVELDNDEDSIIARCINGLRRSEGSGEVIGTPNFSGNVTNDSLQSAHPGLHFGGTGVDNLIDFFFGGTYTPALFNTTNMTSSTTAPAKVLRTGKLVVVSGEFLLDPNGTSLLTEVGIALPYPITVANARDISGDATCDQSPTQIAGATIRGDTVNNRAILRFFAADGAPRTWTYRFEFLVA